MEHQNGIQIDRPVYTQSSLDVAFKLQQSEEPSMGERVKQCASAKCPCGPSQCIGAVQAIQVNFFSLLLSGKKSWKRESDYDYDSKGSFRMR